MIGFMKGFLGDTEGMSDTGLAVHRLRLAAGLTLSAPKRRTIRAEHSMEAAVRRAFPQSTLTGSQFENIESRIPARQKQLTLREAYQIAHTFDVPVLALMVDISQPYRQAKIAEPRKITVLQFVREQLEPVASISLTKLRDADPFMVVKAALRLTNLRKELRDRLDSYDMDGGTGDQARTKDVKVVKEMGRLVARLSRNKVFMPLSERRNIRRVVEDAADYWEFDAGEAFGFEWRSYGRN